MASRTGPLVINIIQIPAGAALGLIDKGLCLTEDQMKFQVSLGPGMTFDSEDRVVADTGETLSVDNGKVDVASDKLAGRGLEANNKKLAVKLGSGLEFDGNDAITVQSQASQTGNGLEVDAQGKLNVKIGPGFIFEDNAVALSPDAEFEYTLSHTTLTDIELFVNDTELTVKKTFTRFDLLRNAAGSLVGVGDSFKFDRFQTVTLPAIPCGYGYGYGCHALATSMRIGTQEQPNFYQK
jgi:hypothetical protein